MLYEPHEDSLLLQKHVKNYSKGNVLDMGTGTGIQARTAKENGATVLAADIDPEAVSHTKQQGLSAVQSDLFENVNGTFDLIIFNPPYLPEDKRETIDERLALTGGKYGHEILDRFLKDAHHHLAKNGKILIVFSTITGDIEHLAHQYGYTTTKLDEESFFFEKIYVYLIQKH